MYWLFLIAAGIFEIFWAISLKYTDGFTKMVPIISTLGFSVLSLLCLSKAMQHIPIGTSYAVWTGIGAIGIAIFGIIAFNESMETGRIISILLIIFGIVGLKIYS